MFDGSTWFMTSDDERVKNTIKHIFEGRFIFGGHWSYL
jgi:hypothetical protein